MTQSSVKMEQLSEQMSKTSASNKEAAIKIAEDAKEESSKSTTLLTSSKDLLADTKIVSDKIIANIQRAQELKTQAERDRFSAAMKATQLQGTASKEATKFAEDASKLYLLIDQAYKNFISIQESIKKISDRSNAVKGKVLQIKNKYKEPRTDQVITEKFNELKTKHTSINTVVTNYESKVSDAKTNRDQALTAASNKNVAAAKSKKQANQEIKTDFDSKLVEINNIFNQIETISIQINDLKSSADRLKTKKLKETLDLAAKKQTIIKTTNKVLLRKQDSDTIKIIKDKQLNIVEKEIKKIQDFIKQLTDLQTDVSKSVINPALEKLDALKKTIKKYETDIKNVILASGEESNNIKQAYITITQEQTTALSLDNIDSKLKAIKQQEAISKNSKEKVDTNRQKIQVFTDNAVAKGIEVDKLVKKTLEDASNAEKADYEAKIAKKMADSISEN